MNRRGFLGLLAGAAASPIASVLPAPAPVLDLVSFNEALKAIYTPAVIQGLVSTQAWLIGASGDLPIGSTQRVQFQRSQWPSS